MTAPEIMITGNEEHAAEPIFQSRHGGHETGKRLGDVASHEKDVVSEINGRQPLDPGHVLRVVRVEIGDDEDARRRPPASMVFGRRSGGASARVESAVGKARWTGHVAGKKKTKTKILCHWHQLGSLVGRKLESRNVAHFFESLVWDYSK